MAKKALTKNLTTTAMIAAGAIAGSMVRKQVLPSMGLEPMIQDGIIAGAGIFLSMQKSPAMQNIGTGMAVIGMVSLISSVTGMPGITGGFSALGMPQYGPSIPMGAMPMEDDPGMMAPSINMVN